jgi:serine/threonine protein phosphatase 1
MPTVYDQIFLLGDYINKGPDSRKTLKYIKELIKKGYLVYPLRGNHEDQILDVAANDKDYLKWFIKQSPDLFKNGTLRKKLAKFLKSLPYYYQLPDFYLVHGGFNFSSKNPFSDYKSMLYKRMPVGVQASHLNNKIVIHGHQPLEIDDILSRIMKRENIIGLDNGVNLIKKHKIYNYLKMGNICALDMDSFRLYVQKNCEPAKHKNK